MQSVEYADKYGKYKGIKHNFSSQVCYILIGQTEQDGEFLKVRKCYVLTTCVSLCLAQCLTHDQWSISDVEIMNEKLQYMMQEVSGKVKVHFKYD